MSRVYEQKTEKVGVVEEKIVSGTLEPLDNVNWRVGAETCKIINYIMLNTYVRFYINIGDRAYPILQASSVPGRPDQMRLFLPGQGSVTVPWWTKLNAYVAASQEEYRLGVKDGCYFPTMNRPV